MPMAGAGRASPSAASRKLPSKSRRQQNAILSRQATAWCRLWSGSGRHSRILTPRQAHWERRLLVPWTELIPILANAPADHATRSKWLERLFEAVQNDGVEYLAPLADRWGEIAQYPDLIDKYADRMIGMVRRAWADHHTFQHVIGTSICLSCLLEGGRYDELQELLATRRTKFWSWHRFGAEALVRQGLWEAAIAFAEAARSSTNPGFSEMSIDRFCEKLLIEHGRSDEAYRRYGLRAASGTTNLSVYRSLVRVKVIIVLMWYPLNSS